MYLYVCVYVYLCGCMNDVTYVKKYGRGQQVGHVPHSVCSMQGASATEKSSDIN